MKYIYVLAFVIVFALFGLEVGYTNQSAVYTHLTFMFQHSGVVHLALNSLTFIGMFRIMEKFIRKWELSAFIITISFASSFVANYDIPTVGASGMVYAMFGMFFGMTAWCDKIKITDTKKYLLSISLMILSLVASFFNPGSNFALHLSSVVSGFIVSIPISIYVNRKTSP